MQASVLFRPSKREATFSTMENRNFEIRSNIKFLVKLEWKGTQIIEALEKVYGTRAPKKTTVYKWIQRFKEGRDDFEDNPRSGRPETSKNDENIEAAQNLIEEDRRITVNQIATSLDISYGSANSILHDNLGLSKLSARWVPKALRPDQQNLRSDLSLTLLNKIEADEEQFLAKIITEMKLGFTSMILSPKKQSKQWLPRGSSGPIKFKSQKSAQKVMATVFWDSEGVILIDYLENQRTVTGVYYV